MKLLSSNNRIFYGWVVVAIAFGVSCFGFGIANTFSVFANSLQHEFGASRGSIAFVFSLAEFLFFGSGIISGPLADRWGARCLTCVGMILCGGGILLVSMARSLTEVYLAYGLGVGVGAGCAYVPILAAVQRWFRRQRGFASGLAVTGSGVGTFFMPLLASHLIQTGGWREAYLILGIFVGVMGVGMSLFIVNDPQDLGLGPDGDPLLKNATAGIQSGVAVGQAIRTVQFAGLYGASLLSSLGTFIPFIHLVPYALEHHLSQTQAASLVSIIGIASISGRFLFGRLADQIGRKYFFMAMFLGMAGSMAIWAAFTNFGMLIIFAALFGIFFGGWVAISPSLLMDCFGGKNLSSILGVLYTATAIGASVGPGLAGFAFDLNHSYTLPILASIGTYIIAALLIAFTVKPASY